MVDTSKSVTHISSKSHTSLETDSLTLETRALFQDTVFRETLSPETYSSETLSSETHFRKILFPTLFRGTYSSEALSFDALSHKTRSQDTVCFPRLSSKTRVRSPFSTPPSRSRERRMCVERGLCAAVAVESHGCVLVDAARLEHSRKVEPVTVSIRRFVGDSRVSVISWPIWTIDRVLERKRLHEPSEGSIVPARRLPTLTVGRWRRARSPCTRPPSRRQRRAFLTFFIKVF